MTERVIDVIHTAAERVAVRKKSTIEKVNSWKVRGVGRLHEKMDQERRTAYFAAACPMMMQCYQSSIETEGRKNVMLQAMQYVEDAWPKKIATAEATYAKERRNLEGGPAEASYCGGLHRVGEPRQKYNFSSRIAACECDIGHENLEGRSRK